MTLSPAPQCSGRPADHRLDLSSRDAQGRVNLATYSFFNAFSTGTG